MKLKRNVVMLPTNNKATAPIFKSNNHLYIGYGEKLEYNNRDNSYQHLYITSDEEIKEGDWCISTNYSSGLSRHTFRCENGAFTSKEWLNSNDCKDIKKIIATTDKSLTISEIIYPEEFVHVMPSPSDGFIKKFIERYNAGNPITEVMVEYEGHCGLSGIECHTFYNRNQDCNNCNVIKANAKLKVDSNNCITITAVKDSWTREELDIILNKFAFDAMTAALHCLLPSDAKHFTNHWTKENL